MKELKPQEIQVAIAYFEDAVKESDEIIDECTPALQAELTEQKQHFVVALNALHRADPDNKALTLKQLKQIDENTDVEIKPLKPRLWHRFKDCVSTGCFETFNYEDYGKTWLAYARKPEGSEP